jgi:NAD dependent epimerase/dehydratase family enzyme
VGCYRFCGDKKLTEESPIDDYLLLQACRQWEAEAARVVELRARVVHTRFGIVLDGSGSALGKMLPILRLDLGGVLGSSGQ